MALKPALVTPELSVEFSLALDAPEAGDRLFPACDLRLAAGAAADGAPKSVSGNFRKPRSDLEDGFMPLHLSAPQDWMLVFERVKR